jgi:hypothetical protein
MVTPHSISDVEAEALLAGADGGLAELTDVAAVLAAIRAAGDVDAGRDFSHLIAPAALESRATPLSRFAEEKATSTVRAKAYRLAPRIAVGAAALFMLIVSTSGLAYAANGAKPGDWLYGLDRAAEVIGIGNGGTAERAAEAQGLAAAGAPEGGLAHAVALLAGPDGNQQASEAVAAAAVRLQEAPQGLSEEVVFAIGELLGYLADATLTGTVNGQEVSIYAGQIGGPTAGDAPGNSGSAPGNDEEGAPGLQDDEDLPGNSESSSGQNDDPAGNSEDAPGLNEEDPPGPPEDAPGLNEEDPPGPPVTTPGRGTPGGTTLLP